MNVDPYEDRQEIYQRPTQILALSGGGVHGLIQTIILADIEKRVNAKAGEIFDLVAGSSIGSLLTAALNLKDPLNPYQCKYSASDLIPIIKDKMRIIFHPNFLNKQAKQQESILPKYYSTGLDRTLEDMFGNALAKDLNGEYYYPAFNRKRGSRPLFTFTSQQARHHLDWENLKIKDILRSTTATLNYFSSCRVILDQSYDLMDGEMIENNPTPTAYAMAKQIFNCRENMTLVSISTEIIDFDIYDKKIKPSSFSLRQNAVAHALIQQLLPCSPSSSYQKGFIFRLEIDEEYAAIDQASNENFQYLTDHAQAWLDDAKNNEMVENLTQRLKIKTI